VDYALRAVRHAIDAGLRDTSFTFIGSGDEFDNVVALSRELGLQDYVEFTGRVSDELLRRYLSTADMGIAPDPKNLLNDVSTMNKIVEYMAMKLPVVSFDLRETRHSAGDAALYVPNDDERAMGFAMLELMRDPARRERMGQIGYQRVAEGLAWDHSRKVLVDFYDRLMGAHRRAAAPAADPRLITGFGAMQHIDNPEGVAVAG
jgi:glycosyltransferase involved in cell wall biosynthesis